jgi:hypothetical protein
MSLRDSVENPHLCLMVLVEDQGFASREVIGENRLATPECGVRTDVNEIADFNAHVVTGSAATRIVFYAVWTRGATLQKDKSASRRSNNVGNDMEGRESSRLHHAVVGEREREREKRFLLDSGTDLHACKHGSMKEGTVYNSARSVSVVSISGVIEKSLGEMVLKLSTQYHKTQHKFQVI